MNTFNDLKTNLTENDISSLTALLGYRCQVKTVRRIESVLTYSASRLPSYGIFSRLTREIEKSTGLKYWSYCAGQSYPDEIRTLRNLILNG